MEELEDVREWAGDAGGGGRMNEASDEAVEVADVGNLDGRGGGGID